METITSSLTRRLLEVQRHFLAMILLTFDILSDFVLFFHYFYLSSRRYGYKSSTDRFGVMIFLYFALRLLDVFIIIPQHNDHL